MEFPSLDIFVWLGYCLIDGFNQRVTNPRLQVSVATKLCTVAPNICGPSGWKWLHVVILAPRILR